MLTFIFFIFAVLSLVGAAATVVRLKNAQGRDDFGIQFSWLTPVSLALSLVFASLAMGNVNVDSGSRGILKRFGQPVETLDPGLHFIRPIGDTVVPVSIQTRVVKPNEDAASKDMQIVHFEITFRYHIDPNFAKYFLVQLNNDQEDRVITPVILEAIKSATSQYDVQELITRRPEARDRIEALISKGLTDTHIIPESTSITDFKFSKEYEDAIEKKQVAQQKAEQATNDLARIKVEAQQVQAEAVGTANAKIASANGEAQSVLIVAKAKAEAQKVQRENITPELIQIRTLELLEKKWTGDFPETYLGGGQGGLNPANILIQPTHREKKQPQQETPSPDNN